MSTGSGEKKGRKTLKSIESIISQKNIQELSWECFLGTSPALSQKIENCLTGVTENEMVRWRHQLNGHEFEQAPGESEGQESLVCCSPWCLKESDTTQQPNNNQQQCSFWPNTCQIPYFQLILIRSKNILN